MKNKHLPNKSSLRSALLVLLLCVMGMTNAVAANHDFTAVAPNGQTLYYKITDATTHTVMVTHPSNSGYSYNPYHQSNNGFSYTKPTGDLIIPYYVEYNGISYSVTAIDEYAFGTNYSTNNACKDLTSVVIPSSVLTIGKQAFASCTGLTTVTIPTSVTTIGSEVFRYCSGLVTVNFNAANCTSVGSDTWGGCTAFTALNLGNTVTRIPTQGFQGATKLASVSLPNNLTTIGDYGFDGCTELASVTCGNASQLDAIGNYSFQNCSSLASINLPNTLNSIGNGAFSGCSQLVSTTETQLLPNAVTSIGDYAFQNASTLAYIRIPSTLTYLGKYAFYYCTSLNTVDFEATNCTFSGTQAEPPFFGCSDLTTINVSDNVTQIPDYCFKDCYGLTNLTLRNGLTSIGSYAFYECRNINTLVLPVSVTAIGSYAFGNAYDMQIARVESHNPTPPTIGGEVAFASGQTIYVPNASVNAYQAADYWSDYTIMGMSQHYDFYQTCSSGQTLYYIIEDAAARKVKVTYAKHYNGYYYQGHPEPAGGVVIPASVTYNNQNYAVTTIDEYAFKDCVRMTAVTLPASISCIEENAFAGCSGLTTVNYNATQCLTMGSSDAPVFAGCSSLTTLNIGTGVNTLPAYAFKNCSHLNCNLIFPNSLLTIGEEAFYGCSGMISQLNFPNAVTTIGDKAFYQCSSLIGNLRLGTAVTSVGVSAFEGCYGLTTLTMYNALEQIGAAAFKGCAGLGGTVTIPNSVVQIGPNAFKDCTSITGLTLGTSLQSIGTHAFENCTGLAVSLVLPNSVTNVGEGAFGASGITGITIPNTVTTIGSEVFMNCESLTQVTLQNNKIATSQFEGCTALTSITIPASITTMQDNAFKNCTGLTTLNLQNHTIGVSAFEGCTGLTLVDIPDCVSNIENQAFYGCTGLTAVSVPYTVTSMGASVFENCTSLASVTLGNTVIGASQFKGCTGMNAFVVPSQIISIGEDAFMNCSNLTEFTYNAENCTLMGSSANPIFGGSTAITVFHIGAGVNTIANYAFKNCGSVTEIHAAPANAPQFTGYDTQYGFADIPQNIPVYVPCNRASYYQNATYWNHFSNYIEDYPYSVTVTANNASMGSATVNQAPSCTNNGQTIVKATPNADSFFINWTKGGNIVSTNPTYSFTPMENTLLVANFADSQITVNVSADPEEGGTVSGGGEYSYGASVTLTAVANTNYSFISWMENGEEVSSNSTYSFTATTNRNLVAHFAEFTNYWVPEGDDFEDNMTLTCVLQLDGVEQASTMFEVGAFCGTQCRGSQRATYFAPTNRYIIQMTVFGENGDVISFRLYDHQQQQELLLTPPTPITINANGYGSLFDPYILNFTSSVSISAEVNPEGAGTITGTGNYPVGDEATLTANPNTGYQFLNWTLNGAVVSTNPSYQFTVTDAAHYVANFKYVHTQALSKGWNWWSSYIELTNNNGLSQLENSIGNSGIVIKSRSNGYVEAYQNNGVTSWYGTLNSMNNEQMYKVRTSAVCNATVVGSLANAASHPINIKKGWNWIGFPCNQSVSVDVAMSGFTPENRDQIKGRNGYAEYYSDENYSMWTGTLTTLEPGKGYMYRSNSTTQKTLVFQTGRGEGSVLDNSLENVLIQPVRDGGSSHWIPNEEDYEDNMTLTGLIQINGVEQQSTTLEVGVFCGDECRGTGYPFYFVPTQHYIVQLLVFGDVGDQLTFKLYDSESDQELELDSPDAVTFTANGYGSLSDPYILDFTGNTSNTNHWIPNEEDYEDNMTLTGLIQINGVEQQSTALEVGVFCGDECRGTGMPTYFAPTQRYIIQLLIFGETNDLLTFKLYDHATGQELNLTSPEAVAFAANGYGSLGNPYILNFTGSTAATYSLNIIGYGTSAGGYYLIASPVTVDPEDVAGMTEGEFDLYYFNQDEEDEWRNYEDTPFDLEPGVGYLYAHQTDITLNFSGEPYTGDGTVMLRMNDQAEFPGMNLVGNPFPESATIDRPFYVLNETGDEIITSENEVVAPMNGVFVIAQTDEEPMTFTPQPSNHEGSKVVVEVRGHRGGVIDRAMIRFDEGLYLPKVMLNPRRTKLFITQDNEDFAVVRCAGTTVTPVSFQAAENGIYTLCVNPNNIEMDYLHLIDNLTGDNVDLLVHPNYTFEATTTDCAARFELVFSANGILGETSDEAFAFVSNGNIIVNGAENTTVQLIDALGHVVATRRANGIVTFATTNLAPGVYVIRLVNSNDTKTQKIVIE